MKVFALVEGDESVGIPDAQIVLDFEGMPIDDFSEGELISIKKNMAKLLKEIDFNPHSVYTDNECPDCLIFGGGHSEGCPNGSWRPVGHKEVPSEKVSGNDIQDT